MHAVAGTVGANEFQTSDTDAFEFTVTVRFPKGVFVTAALGEAASALASDIVDMIAEDFDANPLIHARPEISARGRVL